MTHHISRYDLKPTKDAWKTMIGSVHNTFHVQRLVLVSLVLLTFVKWSLEHETSDVICSEESHNLFLYVLTIKLRE